jgi:Single-strand binding protein family
MLSFQSVTIWTGWPRRLSSRTTSSEIRPSSDKLRDRKNDRDPVIWQPGQDYRMADALQRARAQPARTRWGPERVGPERQPIPGRRKFNMAADNQTTIVGNLVEDPEVRFTNTGIAVTNLRVAVTQRLQQDGHGATATPRSSRSTSGAGRPSTGRLPGQGRPGHGHRPAPPAQLRDPRGRQALGGRDRGR